MGIKQIKVMIEEKKNDFLAKVKSSDNRTKREIRRIFGRESIPQDPFAEGEVQSPEEWAESQVAFLQLVRSDKSLEPYYREVDLKVLRSA